MGGRRKGGREGIINFFTSIKKMYTHLELYVYIVNGDSDLDIAYVARVKAT